MKKFPATPMEIIVNMGDATLQCSFKFVLARARDNNNEIPIHDSAPGRTSRENGEYSK
jgi:hypothetical protein